LWRNPENNTPVAIVFRQIVENGCISNETAKQIIIVNKKKTPAYYNQMTQLNHSSSWELIFKKDDVNHSLTDKAKEILQAKGIRV
jgi:hypothetical protein